MKITLTHTNGTLALTTSTYYNDATQVLSASINRSAIDNIDNAESYGKVSLNDCYGDRLRTWIVHALDALGSIESYTVTDQDKISINEMMSNCAILDTLAEIVLG